ncbi:hypothetical protein DXA19_10940 [Firmicutes bacterium AM59-13]|nr:hypothetical protein DXA19_10940 [Firmicutes bacterium AM59-13]
MKTPDTLIGDLKAKIKMSTQEQRTLSENSPTSIREPNFYLSQVDYNYYRQYAMVCQTKKKYISGYI